MLFSPSYLLIFLVTILGVSAFQVGFWALQVFGRRD